MRPSVAALTLLAACAVACAVDTAAFLVAAAALLVKEVNLDHAVLDCAPLPLPEADSSSSAPPEDVCS